MCWRGLWYHFRTKKDILSAHIVLLQKVFAKENEAADSVDAPVIIDGIFRSYDVIWDFRYVLRDDFNALLEPQDEALATVKGINDVLDQWTEGRMLHAANHGLLSFGSEDAGAVSEIILVLGRYWMDFSHKKYPEAAGADLRHKGISHIFTVLKPISLRRQHSSLNGDFNKDKNPAVFHIFGRWNGGTPCCGFWR